MTDLPPCEPDPGPTIDDAMAMIAVESVIKAVLEVQLARVHENLAPKLDMHWVRTGVFSNSRVDRANATLRTAIKDCAELLP